LCAISQTRKSPIKAKFVIILQLAIVTVAADPFVKRFGAPNVVTNGVSVTISQTDTGIGSSSHLRAQSATTQPSGNVTLSERDKSFMQKAAGGGQQEVENGKTAEKQGQSGDVKRIGARILADHTKANKELTQLASQKGLSFETWGVKAQHLGNAGFDGQYLKLLEADQKNDIAEFQKEAKSGDDRDVKSWGLENAPNAQGTPCDGSRRREKNQVIGFSSSCARSSSNLTPAHQMINGSLVLNSRLARHRQVLMQTSNLCQK
jgi:putative membrane protein